MALVLAAIVFAFVGYVGLQLVRFTQNPEITLSGPAIRQLQPGEEFVTLRGGGTANAAITATGADTGDADQFVRTGVADAGGAWMLSLPVNKGENHFTIIGKDPETARDSAPLKVIVSVPVEDTSLPQGDLGPALPEGVEDTNITGIPSAQLTLLEPRKGLQTKDGKVKVEGSSDAESVVVSFEWRGKLDLAKTAAGADRGTRQRAASSGTRSSCPRVAGSSMSRRRSMAATQPWQTSTSARSTTRWPCASRPSTARRAYG